MNNPLSPLPSVMEHNFSRVPQAEIPRSSFNRSHGYKTTFDAGYLIPFYADEALPGDTFNLKLTAFARLATLLHPYMDNLFLDTQYFAVPVRLIWDNWEKFNGAQDNPADSTDFLTPKMTSPAVTGYGEQSLSDYLGIPTKIPDLEHVSFWHRAYNLIYNEWYRDENLQDSVVVDTDDGPDTPADYTLLRRGKRHDYFTSALPWPQKGVAVPLPLTGDAPVTGIGKFDQSFTTAATAFYETGGTGTVVYANSGQIDAANNSRIFHVEEDPNNTGFPGIYADLSAVTAATINQLREAVQIQKLYERDARGGTRYIEVIKSHFGVTSPDQRLQRPEYLGGGSTPIMVTPVAQTSETGTSPQANLSAFGTVVAQNHGFTASFTEHCVILGIMSVRADLTYQQGLNRMFSRDTRFDFYWPALSHLGEQGVLNKEIYAQGTTADDDVFGYQERYAEYRYKPSLVTGQLRSNSTTPLDTWHLSQDFSALPVLNSSFIEEDPPVDRVIAVPSEPHLILDSHISLTTARPMPVYSIPGMIDHF